MLIAAIRCTSCAAIFLQIQSSRFCTMKGLQYFYDVRMQDVMTSPMAIRYAGEDCNVYFH